MPALTLSQRLQRVWLRQPWRLSRPEDPGERQWREALAAQDVTQAERLATLQVLPHDGLKTLARLAWDWLRQETAFLPEVSAPKQASDGEGERQRQIRVRQLVGALWQAGLDPWSPAPHPDPANPVPLIEHALQQGQLAWYQAMRDHHPAWLQRLGSQGRPLFLDLVLTPRATTLPGHQHHLRCWNELMTDITRGVIQPQCVGLHGENLVQAALEADVSVMRRLLDHLDVSNASAITPAQQFRREGVNVAQWIGTTQRGVRSPEEHAQQVAGMLTQLWHHGYRHHIIGMPLTAFDPLPRHDRDAQGRNVFHAWVSQGPLHETIWAFFQAHQTDHPEVVDWNDRDSARNTPVHALLTRESAWLPKRTADSLVAALWTSLETQLPPHRLRLGFVNAAGERAETVSEAQAVNWHPVAVQRMDHYRSRLIAHQRQHQSLQAPPPVAAPSDSPEPASPRPRVRRRS